MVSLTLRFLLEFQQVGLLNYDSLFAVAQNLVPFEVLRSQMCHTDSCSFCWMKQ